MSFPMTFWGLWAWAVLGLLGLVLQTVWLFKDPLATYQPAIKPILERVCEQVGCQIKPLQKTDAVVIDYASVDLLRSEHPLDEMVLEAQQWALQINLRNSDVVPVATPWVELTLTDVQDKPVVRKVLNLTEWGAPLVMAPGEIMEHELLLSLKRENASFMGYRLLTFYP
jgi:hypothetical protein